MAAVGFIGNFIAEYIVEFVINKVHDREAFQLDDLVQLAVVEAEEVRGVLEFLDDPADQFSQTENDEHHLSSHDQGWTLKARRLVDEVENLSETIKKKIDEISRNPLKSFIALIKYRRMRKELGRLMREILVFSRVARLYFAVFSTSNATRWGDSDSSSVKNRTEKFADVYDALRNLEFTLRKAGVSVHHKLYKEITSIEPQLLPMLDLLNVMKPSEDIDNRQRVWIQILQDSFQSIGNKFKRLVDVTDTVTTTGDILSDHIELATNQEEMGRISLQAAKEFCSFILHMRDDIYKVWNRYHTYRIGSFEGLDGSRLVAHSNLSLQVGDEMYNQYDFSVNHFIQHLKTILVVEDTPKGMVGLQMDTKLMKALIKDTELMGGVLDEREKVWVKQMGEIQQEMEIVNERYQRFQTVKSDILLKQYMNFKLRKRMQLLEEKLEHISMRTRFYCIASPELRFESSNSSRLFPDSWEIKDKVESVKRELLLMEGLFKDVKNIGELDDRLKVWLQEMHCVAREAKAIIERISKRSLVHYVARDVAHGAKAIIEQISRTCLLCFLGPAKAIIEQTFKDWLVLSGTGDAKQISKGSFLREQKIQWIGKRICEISEWSLNYGIEGVRARNGSSSLTEELEETSPYPKDDVEKQVDLIRREVRMLQALDRDIEKMGRFNCGSLQAWVQELREVSVEAETLISSFFLLSKKSGCHKGSSHEI